MTQLTWEKSAHPEKAKSKPPTNWGRYKFLAGGGVLLAVVAILVFSGTLAGARYFVSVDTVVGNPDYIGQSVRMTGAVLGETIEYNAETGDLSFTIAHVPDEFEDLATALHEATLDPSRTRVKIVMTDQVMPDLLQNEAQAILTGTLREDGIFYANSLQLKCPSRFGQEMPEMNASANQTN